MHFTKMHGIRNDYVCVDGAKEHLADASGTAVRVSDRHFGIGSDGLILINPSEKADFEMEMYNADGSRGKMCGNGIRCVGKYVYDHGLTEKTTLRIETLSGIKTLQLHVGEDGKVDSVTVDMGEPVLDPAQIPLDTALLEKPDETVKDYPYEIGGRIRRITCVSMGNPHCVLYPEENIADLDLPLIGPAFEHAPLFPEQVNTEFVNVIDTENIRMRVFERGSGETWACGTGACAAAVASMLLGLTKRVVTVHLRGGELRIRWDEKDGHVYMTGPATEVFTGELL